MATNDWVSLLDTGELDHVVNLVRNGRRIHHSLRGILVHEINAYLIDHPALHGADISAAIELSRYASDLADSMELDRPFDYAADKLEMFWLRFISEATGYRVHAGQRLSATGGVESGKARREISGIDDKKIKTIAESLRRDGVADHNLTARVCDVLDERYEVAPSKPAVRASLRRSGILPKK